MTSISVVTLSSEDITAHLKCDEKRMHQIIGMAKNGKFTDAMMEQFWTVIDVFDTILDNESQSYQDAYEQLGRDMAAKAKEEKA